MLTREPPTFQGKIKLKVRKSCPGVSGRIRRKTEGKSDLAVNKGLCPLIPALWPCLAPSSSVCSKLHLLGLLRAPHSVPMPESKWQGLLFEWESHHICGDVVRLGVPVFGEGDHGAFPPAVLQGNTQDLVLSQCLSALSVDVSPLILMALVEPSSISPKTPIAHEPEVRFRVTDIWGLTMDLHGMLSLAKTAHIPTLRIWSEGKAAPVVQTRTQTWYEFPERPWGHFPSKIYESCKDNSKNKQTKKTKLQEKIDVHHIPLSIPRLNLVCQVMPLSMQYPKRAGTQKKCQFCGGPGKDQGGLGSMAGAWRFESQWRLWHPCGLSRQ